MAFVFAIVVFFIKRYCVGVSNKHCFFQFSFLLLHYFSSSILFEKNCNYRLLENMSRVLYFWRLCDHMQLHVISIFRMWIVVIFIIFHSIIIIFASRNRFLKDKYEHVVLNLPILTPIRLKMSCQYSWQKVISLHFLMRILQANLSFLINHWFCTRWFTHIACTILWCLPESLMTEGVVCQSVVVKYFNVSKYLNWFCHIVFAPFNVIRIQKYLLSD